MAVKKIKARYKWQKSLYPLIKIDHLIVKAFTKQNIITLYLFYDIIWFELNISAELTTFKIGISNLYIQIGGGTNE